MKFAYLVATVPVIMTRMALAQPCPTIPNPGANSTTAFPFTQALAFAAIDAAHIAEGVCARCSAGGSMIETYLPDPATYAALNPDQKLLVLINAERIIRGLPVIPGPGGTNTGVNDPYIGNVTANHALLVAINAGWWLLDIPIIHSNAVDGTFDGRETAPLGPPGLIDNGIGEIAAVNFSPEGAIWQWMYDDASSNWGHRDNILSCTYTMMGSGVATTPANIAQWGAGAQVYIVDFIHPQTSSAYTAPILPPPAPCPPVPAPTTWTCPTVVPPKVFSELGGGIASLSADGTTINIAANVSVDSLNGAANQVRSFLVFQSANWAQPNNGVPALGVAPQGTGAFSCPLIPVLHTALDPTDPAVNDPAAVTSRCVVSIPFTGNPVVISITDTYNGLVYVQTNLSPPM
jgi:hypothetical protein